MYQDNDFNIDCTGDVCVGDTIMFTEAVFAGTYSRNSRRAQQPIGERTIIGEIVKDSYGAAKQQHTFTIQLIDVTGDNTKEVRQAADKREGKIMRKGRNVYRNGTKRLPRDESERTVSLAEKHDRGRVARQERWRRRNEEFIW